MSSKVIVKKGRIKCKFCNIYFDNERERGDHNTKFHKNEFTCEICSNIYRGESQKLRHQFHKHANEMGLCKICDITFADLKDMKQHKKFHSKEYPYLCLLCITPFCSLASLRRHLNIHEQDAVNKILKKNTDDADNKTCRDKTVDLKPQAPPKVYVCDVCGIVARTRRQIITHFISHETKGIYKCDICDRKYEFKGKLLKHLAIHRKLNRNKPEKKPRLCDTCGKSCMDDRALRRHKEYHLPTGCFPCKMCNREFDLNIKLKIHMRSHTRKGKYVYVKKRPGKPGRYPCGTCGKVFNLPRSLSAHKQMHKVSLQCPLCDRVFNKKWNLQTHMDIHQGKKPYSCSHCGAKYADRSNLKKHLLKHPTDVKAMPVSLTGR